MQLPKAICVVCKSELKHPAYSEHCDASDCRMDWLRGQSAKAQAAREQRHTLLVQEMQSTTAIWQNEHQNVRRIKTVEVPHNPHGVVDLGLDRKDAFLAHLEDLFDSDDAVDSSRLFAPLLEAESTDGLAPVLGSLCATCNGFCCSRGKDTHAFIQKQTLDRVLAAEPYLSKKALLDQYERYLPEQAIEDSCVFHTASGCCLAAELKADICDSFFCKNLHDFIDSDFIDGSYDAAIVFGVSELEIKTVALIGSGGERSVLKQ